MEEDMLDGLYWEYLYNDGTDKRFICPGGEEAVGPCPVAPADRNILYENRLLGLPRIRQIRVRNDSCQIHPDFQNAIKHCYNEYSESNEDREPFGTGFRQRTSAKAWSYNEKDVTKGNTHPGEISSYGPGGAIQVTIHIINLWVRSAPYNDQCGVWGMVTGRVGILPAGLIPKTTQNYKPLWVPNPKIPI